VTLQCPIKSTVPQGTKCGRRERESRREGRREQSLRAHDSFAWRGGQRHPGLLEGGTLRGASSERGPRSVRLLSWVPPADRDAPMTADVRRTPRRGTPSACATKRTHPTQAREIVACARGRVLRSVLRPVHVDPHYAPWRKPRRWGVRFGITEGQARATEKNLHWGRDGRTERGSPRVTASAREKA
jgi:hypothetical protein